MKTLFVVASVAAALAAAPAANARVQTETAQRGPTSASLTYDRTSSRDAGIQYRDLRVTIDRAGVRMVDQPVGDDCRDCWPVSGGSADVNSVTVRDLDADQEPEVLFGLYTGGANCCFMTIVWRWLEASNTWVKKLLQPGGSFGYRLKDLNNDGAPEFISQDQRFAFRYGANVETPRPLRIWNWDRGRLVNVTLAYAPRAAREAASLYRTYLRLRKEKDFNARGVLAAYLADEYSAGRGAIGWRRVVAAYRRGDVDKQRSFDRGPFGRAYLTSLRSFLKKLGYLQRS